MNSSVSDVMTRNVVAVRETAGYKDIVAVMRRRRVSAFPVVDSSGRVLGVVSEADLLLKEAVGASAPAPSSPWRARWRRKERAKAAGVSAGKLMSKPAVTITQDATVAQAARAMYRHRVKRLPVVDESGHLVGIVSRVDVLGIFDRQDEQIRNEVIKKVIAEEFALDPAAFDVTVTAGIVTVVGHVEREAVASHLIDAVRYVEGVVDVRDRISYPPGDAPKIAGLI